MQQVIELLLPRAAEAATVTISPAANLVPTVGEFGMMLLVAGLIFITFKRYGRAAAIGMAPVLAVSFYLYGVAANTIPVSPTGSKISGAVSVGLPGAITLQNTSTLTSYNPSQLTSGNAVFENIPTGTYQLNATLNGQTPRTKIPVTRDNDSITCGYVIHTDDDDVDGDNDTSEYAMTSFVRSGADFDINSNTWTSAGTATKSVSRVHVCGSLTLPSGSTLNGTAQDRYTYFDNDDDGEFNDPDDVAGVHDIDGDMKEAETKLNRDIDGNGTIEDVDEDIDEDGIENASDDDIDGDGLANADDDDDDGDGLNDSEDSDDNGDGIDD